MRKKGKFLKKLLPVYASVMLGISFVCLLVYVAARIFPSFADALNGTVCHALRRAFAFVADAFPFSLAEVIILASPAVVFLIIFRASRVKDGTGRIRFISGLLSVISLFFSLYWLMLGVGYHTVPISEKIGMDEAEVNKESLALAFSHLAAECNSLAEELELDESGASVMPISFDEVCDHILGGYRRLSEDIPQIGVPIFDSRAKRVMLSKPMSALEITGVYTFFTGEANVNVYYPDYNLPFTAAHELAHQRGIARENEANFIAFLVCIASDHPYVRYSGYMNMLEYVASALKKTDPDEYRLLFSSLHPSVVSEMRSYSEFYNRNKKKFWSDLSDSANDNYLKAQGTEGIASYGLVVRLCVSYYAAAEA